MKNDTRSKLETLLDNYEKKQLEEEIKQEQIQTAKAIFLENFVLITIRRFHLQRIQVHSELKRMAAM